MEIHTWNPDQFRHALLAGGRGKNYLPHLGECAPHIELSTQMHSILNGLRLATAEDAHERWAMFGINPFTYSLHVSEFVKGERDHIPGKIIQDERLKAKRAGIQPVAHMHSHPEAEISPRYLSFLRRPYSLLAFEHAQFSAGDMYKLVLQDDFLPVMFLVAGKRNLLALRTQETNDSTIQRSKISQKSFAKYWYDQLSLYLEMLLNPLALNINIARRHNLALYAGDRNEELMRVYPPTLEYAI